MRTAARQSGSQICHMSLSRQASPKSFMKKEVKPPADIYDSADHDPVSLGSRSRPGQPQRATQPTYLKSSLSDAANAAKVAKVV